MDAKRTTWLHGALMLLWLSPVPAASDDALVQQIAESGRCATLAEPADRRANPGPAITPGQPPLLSFRYYEGKQHRRYGNSDLMLDDAGH